MELELDSFSALTDQHLLEQVVVLATREREATARLIAALAEVELRRLYLAEGFSSLFTYCTQALHFSEDAAYNRMKAARVASRWPLVRSRIADGSVTLTAVRLLAGFVDGRESSATARLRQPQEQARDRTVRRRAASSAGSAVHDPKASCREACAGADLRGRPGGASQADTSRARGRSSDDPPITGAFISSRCRGTTRTGPLQSPNHREPRNPRQASKSSGSPAASDSRWRSCGHLRPRPYNAVAGSGAPQAGADDASEGCARGNVRYAPRARGAQAGGLET